MKTATLLLACWLAAQMVVVLKGTIAGELPLTALTVVVAPNVALALLAVWQVCR